MTDRNVESAASRPLRVAAVVSYFPTSAEPHTGMPIFNQMKAMAGICDLTVLVVRPDYPSIGFLRPRSFLNRSYDPQYSLDGIRVHYIGYPALPLVTRGLNGRSCAKRLLPVMETVAPDVILSYIVYPEGNAAVRCGARLGVPVVVGAVGTDLRRIPDAWTRSQVKYTLHRATHIVTKSRELRQQAIGLGAPAAKVTAILNGCDGHVFRRASRADARAGLSISPGTKLAVFTGRLVSVKNLPGLLDAVARVRTSGVPLELAMIGDGPLAGELRDRARSLQIEPSVRFLGPQSPGDVARWLAACDVFCLSSFSEGCPNVILEALSCGRPVVATRVGGIPELVDDRCGILVPPDDPAAFAAALIDAVQRTWDEDMISLVYRRDWATMARESLSVCAAAARQGSRGPLLVNAEG